ncbi:cytochrome P450 [Alkalihalobacillus sp. 1P02AB]|uniref:cytochrome P450 n=1 Tax=Alkalihalobacillus sp. 1P02AB TaxID=3132260 RepID=UPI0039A4B010
MKDLNLKYRAQEIFQNPYPFYDELRSKTPIYKGNFFKYPGWYVTGYEEANLILKNQLFLNRAPIPENSKRYDRIINIQQNMLLFQNPPDQTRLRKIVRESFTPKALEELIPFIEDLANKLIQEGMNKQKVNIVSDIAFPLASLVIAKILGIPEEDKHLFREWSINLIETLDLTRTRESLITGNATMVTMLTYFQKLINIRKQAPQDDLISLLLRENQNENKLTKEELLATCLLLVIAGHETTVNLISNSVYCLLTNTEQYHLLQENPSLIESAIEEFLRYESPTQLTARVASENMKLNQIEIKKGDHMYILLGAANRDPRIFIKPDVLDITRNPNPHLAFGSGIHFCLGSILAKLETKIVLQTLLQNTKTMQLETTNLQWRDLIGFRALKELHITF